MILAVFRKFLVLFFCYQAFAFGQGADNEVTIELGIPNLSIERPYTISVIIPNSESRPTIQFPDIAGFVKRGTSASVTTSDIGGKTVTRQIITQNYQARAAGRFVLPPFSLTINSKTVASEGAVLVVRPSATAPNSATAMAPKAAVGAAFLSVSTSQQSIYVGEAVGLTLSFFVADNYPFELNFTALDKQLQEIIKRLRPANAWEENLNIVELKPFPVLIDGKKFRQFRLYHAIFFPLSARPLQIPSVSLWLARQPVIGPPTAQPETILFASRPLSVTVRPLPAHPLRGRVPVGIFRLNETLDRLRVVAGQSVRYTFSVAGEGNIATLPPPELPVTTPEVDVFPPQTQQQIDRAIDHVTGHKSFTYFVVPHQNGLLSLANRFQWIYFDLQKGRYDTLRPQLTLRVGGTEPIGSRATQSGSSVVGTAAPGAPNTTGSSLYAGIETMDSSQQPLRIPVLVRAIANVLIVVMLLGMMFMFFRK